MCAQQVDGWWLDRAHVAGSAVGSSTMSGSSRSRAPCICDQQIKGVQVILFKTSAIGHGSEAAIKAARSVQKVRAAVVIAAQNERGDPLHLGLAPIAAPIHHTVLLW